MKKLNIVSLGMLAAALVFGLSIAGCKSSSSGGGIGLSVDAYGQYTGSIGSNSYINLDAGAGTLKIGASSSSCTTYHISLAYVAG
jgi:hypothetical protein